MADIIFFASIASMSTVTIAILIYLNKLEMENASFPDVKRIRLQKRPTSQQMFITANAKDSLEQVVSTNNCVISRGGVAKQ